MTDLLEKLLPLLKCLRCGSDLKHLNGSIGCTVCNANYSIIDGIPRFVPKKFYVLNTENDSIQEKTKNYFGFEWDYFRDWGFIPNEELTPETAMLCHGGTVDARQKSFDSKCKLTAEDLSDGKVVLDAGCGNGRYTYEAGVRNEDALVIGVDVGYGSVQSAYANTSSLPNVLILQADLFDLPFKDQVIDSCFSNGVLMHTGNAEAAFKEIARTIKPDGVFVAHVYNKLNSFWEINDYLLRSITTRLSIDNNLKLAKLLARISGSIEKRSISAWRRINYFMRLQSTVHHMYDWYAAPIATHHPLEELKSWFDQTGLEVLEENGENTRFWRRPWACNVKGKRPKTDVPGPSRTTPA